MVTLRPAREQVGEVVVGEPVEDAQLEVRQRADGQRDALAREPLDQRRVLDAAHAVVDALGVQQVERLSM